MMSIRLGIYDLFANLIPGFLYLFVLEEIGKLLNLPISSVLGQNGATFTIVLVVASFIVGHVFNSLSFQFWYRVFIRKHDGKIALGELKQQYPNARFNFSHDDEVLIQSLLYREGDKLLEKIESLHASALFLRNISFGFFMLFVAEVIAYIQLRNSTTLFISGISLVFSILALRQARTFYRWFYRNVFIGALNHSEIIDVVIKGRNPRGKK